MEEQINHIEQLLESICVMIVLIYTIKFVFWTFK